MLMVPTELRASPIHGVGVFLTVPVLRGSLIWRFDSRIDRIYADHELGAMPEMMQEFIRKYSCWDRLSNTWMFAGDNSRFVNHSEAPSLVTIGNKTTGDDVAAFDLPAGVELTSDYRDICDEPLDYIYSQKAAA